jgi:hypothetical protein
VRINASAPRRITAIIVRSEGYILGMNDGGSNDIQITIPNGMEKGFHDLVVDVRDDVGNTGSASVTINLTADAAPAQISVTDPAPGSVLKSTDFPRSVVVHVSDIALASRVDLVLQPSTGNGQILVSDFAPSNNPLTFAWNNAPSPGSYALFAVVTTGNGQTLMGDRVQIAVQ